MESIDEFCRNQRRIIRKKRHKIKLRIIETIPVHNIVEIIIDYICLNRSVINTLHDIASTGGEISRRDMYIRGVERWGEKDVGIVYDRLGERAIICFTINDIIYLITTDQIPKDDIPLRDLILSIIYNKK